MIFSFFEDFFDIVFTIGDFILRCFSDEKVSTCWWNWKNHDKKKSFFRIKSPICKTKLDFDTDFSVKYGWNTSKMNKSLWKKFISPICKDGQISMLIYHWENKIFSSKFPKSILHVIHFWNLNFTLNLHMGKIHLFFEKNMFFYSNHPYVKRCQFRSPPSFM